jgi:hypothetical protein
VRMAILYELLAGVENPAPVGEGEGSGTPTPIGQPA